MLRRAATAVLGTLLLATGVAGAATIGGSAGDDDLRGTDQADVLLGFAGDDVLRGLGGDDLLRGGPGIDRIWGGRGNDELRGGAAWSRLHGGFGDDLLVAPERGKLFGGPGDDRVHGGPSFDAAVGGYGDDVLRGRGGDDELTGGYGDDRILGGPGDDFLSDTNVLAEREEWWQAPVPSAEARFIEHDSDLLVGGPGRDNILVMSGPDRVFGGAGNDEIKNFGWHGAGDGFADLIHCGPGEDAVYLYSPTDPHDKIAADCEHIITFPFEPDR